MMIKARKRIIILMESTSKILPFSFSAEDYSTILQSASENNLWNCFLELASPKPQNLKTSLDIFLGNSISITIFMALLCVQLTESSL